ncbi:DDB1- and CUL4-associated factor 1-like isoform X1 [Antennarius striatus]|uniref:DDB1- and CUL4-associated factor 1-like isoform X1 n=1 Tax=Antennarius striatus TaxID=241820 RepID=UPI0035B0B856
MSSLSDPPANPVTTPPGSPSSSDAAATEDSKAELVRLLDQWKKTPPNSTDQLVSVLSRMSGVIERETAVYHRTDPDPFDDRHPGRADPGGMLGELLKMLFVNPDVTNELFNVYLVGGGDPDLVAAACRLLINILPGLETSIVFQDKDVLLATLFSWGRDAEPPLCVFAVGLLGRAMSVQEVATGYRQENAQLVPVVIRRLRELQAQDARRAGQPAGASWSEVSSMLIGSDYCLSPLSPAMEQRLLLQYLTPLGDHQELLPVFVQTDACALLMTYVDLRHTRDVRLTFDALLFLASLLLHKKFAVEFIANGGVQKLLDIPRPSLAATAVSLCLYYLAYNQDAMERVCMLPEGVLAGVVSYALWLLESSHASGVCHSTMFFSISFCFRVVLQLFDQQDGLRRLVNLISTLEILKPENEASRLTDDQTFSCRQTAKHTCMALRRYFEAHLAVKAEQVKQSLHPSDGGTAAPQQPFYKAYVYSREQVVEMMEFLIGGGPPQLTWGPVDDFYKLSCVPLLLQLISAACDWRTYYGRSDTVRYALDILAVLMVVPKVQLVLADTVEVLDQNRSPVATVGMSIVLGVAEGEVFVNDAEIQKSALQIIINCVCAPDQSITTVGAFAAGPHRPPPPPHSRVLAHLWRVVQNNNGIKVLLSLLSVRTPLTDADLIRALACKALVGVSRGAAIRQIISKLPLFTSGHIQQLMKEPVLQDKRSEHVRFCRYAAELTERVSGKPLLMRTDVSLARLQRESVVAQSRITFSQKELLVLIRNHLVAKGLHDTANTLTREASLSLCPGSSSCLTPPPSSSVPRTLRMAPRVGTSPAASRPPASSSSSSSALTPPHPHGQISRILFSRERPAGHAHSGKRLRSLRQKSDHGAFIQTPAMKKQLESALPSPPTLDSIITEYLREQHARCPNPVTTCPPFSLYAPHRCPEPKRHRQASPNFSARLGSRALPSKYGGVDQASLDRRLIFSRFRPVSVFLEAGGESGFTCGAFSGYERHLVLGTCTGHLKRYSVASGALTDEHDCESSSFTHLESSRDGRLLLTSACWGVPLSDLRSLDGAFTRRLSFADEHHVEFSKLTQDRVVGTKDQVARVYDIQTGVRTLTLSDPALANHYKHNNATFSPTDELLLSDGVLWDVRRPGAVHKFDKFNTSMSGVFHPHGQEVVINTEIWDLRTFHLLHTVPDLDQCRLVFNGNATVLYAAPLQGDYEPINQVVESPFGSTFRTFEASGYKPIATVDVKRNIFDIWTDTTDCYLATVENLDTASLDTVCRLYDVGRQKLAEEGEDDDQDDEDQDDDEDSSDSADDDDGDEDTDPLIARLVNGNDSNRRDSSPTEQEIAALLGYEYGDDSSTSQSDGSDSESDLSLGPSYDEADAPRVTRARRL